MIPIPSTSKDLTPQWFTSILKLKGINHVTSVNLQPLGEADSVSGDIYRVRLTYSNKILHNPESVVIKLPRPRNQRTSMLLDAYRVEVSFYRTIAPTIGVRVPKHIYSDIDPETSDYVLVIEDFPDSTNVRNETGATIDQAYKLLEYMAKLHAWYWLKPDLVGYKWPYSLNEKLIDQTVSEISKCLTLFLSRFGEYIQTGEYGVLEA